MGELTGVRFVSGPSTGAAVACVHIHWGGPPNEMAAVFENFFERNEKDYHAYNMRYDDAGVLAARFLVFMSTYDGYDSNSAEQPDIIEINGLSVVADDPQRQAAEGWWLYSVVCSGSRSLSALRPSVLYHDVMTVPDESDSSKRSVIWQRFLTLREAADNFNTEKQDG